MGLFKKTVRIDRSKLMDKLITRVDYIGLERGNLVIGIAKVAMACNLKVAILDSSLTHDVYNAYKDGNGKVVIRDNLTVVKNGIVPDDDNKGYDMIIKYYGCNVPKTISSGDYVILGIAPDNNSIAACKRARSRCIGNSCKVIYRDADGTYGVSDVCHDLGLVSKKNVTVMDFEQRELEIYNQFTRDISSKLMTKFKKKQMKVFITLLTDIFGLDDVTLDKCVRKGDAL